jgi:galactose oxidase
MPPIIKHAKRSGIKHAKRTGDGSGERGRGTTVPEQAGDLKKVGRWDPVFSLPNVAIHTNLLPNGKVLFWGRRDTPKNSLDVHACTPLIWDPITGRTTTTPRPRNGDGRTINLFCSGHSFLPDGRLLVAGGHLLDGLGLEEATIYDYRNNSWTPLPVMNTGRWYPTALTLEDGTVLVLAGDVVLDVPQIWDGAAWRSLDKKFGLPLYPRVHVAPNGQVFMSGTNKLTQMLDTNGAGRWTPLPGPGGSRKDGERQYAPSVMYNVGKVIYIGGGNDACTYAPSAKVEIIDLTARTPAWRATSAMHHRRRQHNATILPDGMVLVTGGTQGGGGPNNGFNDLTPGQPVHTAEL